MQSDDAIWSLIGLGESSFCSYKVKTQTERKLCRNPYNTVGICSRLFCPLANSQYATVIEHKNKLYLYMKTPERSHLPLQQWKKTELPKDFLKALKLIDEKLIWWNDAIRLKCKQRALRLKQMILRKKRSMNEDAITETVEVRQKEERRLRARERKAESRALIESSISAELLKRLKEGTYDSIIEQDEETLNKVLDLEKEEEQKAREKECAEEVEYVADEDFEEDIIQSDAFQKIRRKANDIEDIVAHEASTGKVRRADVPKKKERVVIRREVERVAQPKEKLVE